MISSLSLSRRAFLRIVAALATMGVLNPSHGSSTFAGPRDDPLALKLASLFTHKGSARIIGSEYLRVAPEEANIQRLLDLICPGSPEERARLSTTKREELLTWVVLRQRQDFGEGRWVNARGWILSKTEARLYALVSLV